MDKLGRAFWIFSLAGAFVCILTLFFSSAETDETYLTASTSQSSGIVDGDSEASADPFGYFMGKWNLWEYIGDSVSSLIQ